MGRALALRAADDLVDVHQRPNEIDVLAHESKASAVENELKHSEMMMSGAMHELVEHPELPDTRPQDIVEAVNEQHGVEIQRQEVRLPGETLRQTGEYPIVVHFHADVEANVTLHVEPEA